MDNIFTLQFPESRFDADDVLDALKAKTILTAKEWDVWPFLANVNPIEDADDYEEGEVFSSQDRIMLGFMRQELLHQNNQTPHSLHPSCRKDISWTTTLPATGSNSIRF